jgi:hypothetical protein
MFESMTNILIKLFARTFYKVHSGLLVFLFVSVISYCFFINTAGDVKLMSSAQAVFYNFILLITFVSKPIMTILFFIAWLLYSIKSWQHVSGQLLLPENAFLFYSVNSFKPLKQFKGWFYMQFIICLPFVFYAVIAAITGIVFKHYLIVAFVMLFTFLLIAVSALVYVRLMNNLIRSKNSSLVFKLSRQWKKPFFSLTIYYVLNHLKLGYFITKLLSYFIIIGTLFSFADVRHDLRVAAIIVLGIATAHAMLIYQQYKFGQTYLGITRNFPYGINRLYLYHALNYLFLLLPEVIWLFLTFNILTAIGLLVLLLGIVLLFYCMLYKIGTAMNKYLPRISGLFVLLFWIILFGGTWLLAPLCIIISFAIFYTNYYKSELIAGV